MTQPLDLFSRLGDGQQSTHTMCMHLDDNGLSIAGISIEAGYCEMHGVMEIGTVIATSAMGGGHGDEIHQ